jgi:3-deoxy-D-arabino-heptulosonate 7-phosphate (DAHP) synthase class II
MSVCEGDYILTTSKWDELVWIWERTRAPKGCKVEITEGIVTVVPLATSHITASPNGSSGACTP